MRCASRSWSSSVDGEQPGHPGPPPTPANTFKWPWLRFVPSRIVHILYSELKPPQQPVTNHSGPGLQAYGYTLTEAIVHAWRGNRWHIDIVDGLDDGTRYDFYIQFAQNEPVETFAPDVARCHRAAVQLSVTRETRPRDVWVARSIGHGGPMLRSYGEAEPGSGFAMANFNLVMNRPHDAPLFPLEPFAVHSVPFFYLASWFEEFLGGQVIDETGLRGLYGFELTRTVANRRRADRPATRPGWLVNHARTAGDADTGGASPLSSPHSGTAGRQPS